MIISMVRDYIEKSGLSVCAKDPQVKPKNGSIAQNRMRVFQRASARMRPADGHLCVSHRVQLNSDTC